MSKSYELSPYEIAAELGIGHAAAGFEAKEVTAVRKRNGRIVNELLAAHGLQSKAKRKADGWVLTPKGRTYGDMGSYEKGGEVVNSTIKWDPSVVEFLRPHVQPMTEAVLGIRLDNLEASVESIFAQLERIERMLCNIVEVTPGIKDFDPPYVGNVACGVSMADLEEPENDQGESEAEAAE